MPSLFDRLDARAQQIDSLLCVGLDPHPALLKQKVNRQDASGALAFCSEIVDQTADLALAYKPNSAFFEALGSMGIEALRALIARIRTAAPGALVILDAKRGDIASTADAYARAAFDYLDADALTVNPYLGKESITPFLNRPRRGVFVLALTSNPGAADFQHREIGAAPLYQHIAETMGAMGEDHPGQVGLVVGATDPHSAARVRQVNAEAWYLVPGVGAQGGDLSATLRATRRPDGMGVLITASRSIAEADDPRAEALRLRDAIRAVQPVQGSNTLAAAERRLALALYTTGCVKFGTFTLKSGAESPIYMDLRRLISSPPAMHEVVTALAALVRRAALPYDHLAALPYAALPIGAVLAYTIGASLIYPRREAKDYGTKAVVEGVFKAGDRALVVDDLATTGESKFEAIEKLTTAGLSPAAR